MEGGGHVWAPSEGGSDEEGRLRYTLTALHDALVVLSSPPTALHSSDVSVGKVMMLIEAGIAELAADPSVRRVGHLLFSHPPPSFLELLLQFLAANLTFAPGASSPDEAARQFTNLRVYLLQTLSKLIAMTSADHVAPSQRPAGFAESAAECARVLEKHQAVEMLVGITSASKTVPDDVRVASSECLFVLAMRNETGRRSISQTKDGLEALLKVLGSSASPMIRNYCAACLREVANSAPGRVADSGFLQVAPGLVRRDTSADARVIMIETIDVVYQAHKGTCRPPHVELSRVLHMLLLNDTNMEVADAACKLIDSVVAAEAQEVAKLESPPAQLEDLPCPFTLQWVGCGGVEALATTILSYWGAPARVAALAARAWRRLIEVAFPAIGVGRRALEGGDLVTKLLRALEHTHQQLAEGSSPHEMQTVGAVELTIGIALALAQSAAGRVRMKAIAGQRMQVLRDVLLKELGRASLEYFKAMPVVDFVTMRVLNSLSGVSFDKYGWPEKDCVRRIFAWQVAATSSSSPPSPTIPLTTEYDTPAVEEERRARLTYVLLRYAVHLAFTEGNERSSTPSTQGMSQGEDVQVEANYDRRTPFSTRPSNVPWSSSKPAPSAHQPPFEHRTSPPRAPHHTPPHPDHPLPQPPYQPSPTHYAPAHHPQHVHPPAHPPQQPHHSAHQHSQHPALRPRRSTSEFASATHSSLLPRHRESSPPGLAQHSTGRRRSLSAAHQHPQPHPGHASHRSKSPATTRSASSTALPPTVSYTAHDVALALAVRFSRHFSNMEVVQKEVTPRFPTPRSGNPWKPPVAKRRTRPKTWTVSDLKEGDLFIFTIPYHVLSVAAIEGALLKAARHQAHIKRAFLTTPQRAKGRRWMLHDMLNCILPHIQDLLIELARLLVTYGETNVMHPISILRQAEIEGGEESIHPGNIVEVVEQVQYYFQHHPVPSKHDVLKEVDEKMRALATASPLPASGDLNLDDSLSSSSSSSSSAR